MIVVQYGFVKYILPKYKSGGLSAEGRELFGRVETGLRELADEISTLLATVPVEE